MPKSLAIRYNLSVVALQGLCVVFPLMRMSENHWIPVAMMFLAGLLFGYSDGHAILDRRDALLEAKDDEDVRDILQQSWRSPRFVGFLCVGVIGATAAVFAYSDDALWIATASIWVLIAGSSVGRLPGVVMFRRYACSKNALPAV